MFTVPGNDLLICFFILQLKGDKLPWNLSAAHFNKSALQLARRGDEYQYYREIADQFYVEPGVYVIIPSTYKSRDEADYLLRVYSEASADGR